MIARKTIAVITGRLHRFSSTDLGGLLRRAPNQARAHNQLPQLSPGLHFRTESTDDAVDVCSDVLFEQTFIPMMDTRYGRTTFSFVEMRVGFRPHWLRHGPPPHRRQCSGVNRATQLKKNCLPPGGAADGKDQTSGAEMGGQSVREIKLPKSGKELHWGDNACMTWLPHA